MKNQDLIAMNDHKFCFIICVNNEQMYRECVYYINNLTVPEDYEIDIISIREADSLTSAYNAAMQESDAKYKIYLHQDLYIINKNFLYDVLNVFHDKSIGMFGLAGCRYLPASNKWWESQDKYGKVYESRVQWTRALNYDGFRNYQCQDVEVIDGMFMVTQYDCTWREDLFTGWHFYDASQCFEFMRQGYRVVVPFQKEPWCLHDCGIVSTENYDIFNKVFENEYR